MEKLLKFVDDYVFETQLYFRMKSLYREQEYELQWLNKATRHWRIRKVGNADWQTYTSKELVGALNKEKIDISEFELALRATVLEQVAYAETFLQRAKGLFGEETIAAAIEANKEFLKSLESTLQSLLDLPPAALAAAPKEKTSLPKPPKSIKPSSKRPRRTLHPKDKGRSKTFLRLLTEDTDYNLKSRGTFGDS